MKPLSRPTRANQVPDFLAGGGFGGGVGRKVEGGGLTLSNVRPWYLLTLGGSGLEPFRMGVLLTCLSFFFQKFNPLYICSFYENAIEFI